MGKRGRARARITAMGVGNATARPATLETVIDPPLETRSFAPGHPVPFRTGELRIPVRDVVLAAPVDGATTRRWSGTLVLEGVQTGDGRVIAEGALEWADLPLPLAWLALGDQHVYSSEAPVIGNIDRIERSGQNVDGAGIIDLATEEGAEVVRMMESGTAPHGDRFFVSVDPDDYEVEIILTDAEEGEDDVVIVASGPWPPPGKLLEGWLESMGISAAAGDPDPGEGGGEDGVTLFEDASDSIIERYTRLRIRGATLCAVSAFDGATIGLEEAGEPDAPVEEPEDEAASAALAACAETTEPPASFFSEPPITELERFVTITDEGRIYGDYAGAGECHIGYLDVCVEAPLTASSLAYWPVGQVKTREGALVPTGPLALRGGHYDGKGAERAQAHYDDPATAIADVATGIRTLPDGTPAGWFSGALRPGVTPEQAREVLASGVSGDWRRIEGELRLIGICCVNRRGYTNVRLQLAASGELEALFAAGGRPEPHPDSEPALASRVAALEIVVGGFLFDRDAPRLEALRERLEGPRWANLRDRLKA